MILLPGNNSLVLCPAAIMQIVEEHLNKNLYASRSESHVRVTNVQHSEDTFFFSVTTDEERK